jgi:TonB family protein
MNQVRCCLLCLILIVLPWPSAGHAAPADEQAAEQCVGYSRTAPDSFNLFNNCDWPIEVAICAEDAGANCTSADSFSRHLVATRAPIPGVFRPLQVLSVFACRSPAVVRVEAGGRASCDPTGTANLPLLLASSLKNAASIITAADYPRGVTASGTTRFEMAVAADGRPQSCTLLLRSSGKEALDKATCDAFMKRARFTPAKDANGVASPGAIEAM